MDTRNVVGLSKMRFAIVNKHSNVVHSVYQHPDFPEKVLSILPHSDDFEVVEILDEIGYKRR